METPKLDNLIRDAIARTRYVTGYSSGEYYTAASELRNLKAEVTELKAQLAAHAAGPWQPIEKLTVFDGRDILLLDGNGCMYAANATEDFEGNCDGLAYFAEIRPFKAENTEEATTDE